MNVTQWQYCRNITSLLYSYKEGNEEDKEMEIIFGGIAFVVLFAAWVVIPSLVKKRHAVKANEEVAEELR